MSPNDEIYILEETLKNIEQQAKKSGAKPPHDILVKMLNIKKRLEKLKGTSTLIKAKPENLPDDLKSVRDLAVDYALGRIKELPNNIDELYEWLQIDGDAITSALEAYAVDIEQLAANHFSDYELDDPEDNSSQQRLKFAREFINNIFGDDSNYIRWICGAWLENDDGEAAIAGTILESHGQAGLYFIDTGIYKSVEDFLNIVKQSSNLVLENEIGNLTDEKLLSLWEG